MKKKLDIIEVEEKSTQGGKPYARYNTSEGFMNCFDKKANEALKACVGQNAEVEVKESEGVNKDGDKVTYRNIAKFYGVDTGVEQAVKSDAIGKRTDIKPTRTMPKDPVGLAVEIFNSIYEKNANSDKKICMDTCIDLVKQAQKAFS